MGTDLYMSTPASNPRYWWVHHDEMPHNFGAMPGQLFKTLEGAKRFMAEQAKPHTPEVVSEQSTPEKILVNLGAERYGWICKVEVE
jgi:hypothetical protein